MPSSRMQWFMLILFAVSMLASISASVAVLLLTKNPLALSVSLIPTPLLLAMRPIIRYLFPAEEHHYRRKRLEF